MRWLTITVILDGIGILLLCDGGYGMDTLLLDNSIDLYTMQGSHPEWLLTNKADSPYVVQLNPFRLFFIEDYHKIIQRTRYPKKNKILGRIGNTVLELIYDWIHQNLYLLQENKIVALNIDVRKQVEIYRLPMQCTPKLIKIDPMQGCRYLFWIEQYNSISRIMRTSLNGSHAMQLTSVNGYITELVTDPKVQRLYWVDAKSVSVYFINYDGTQQTKLLKTYHPLKDFSMIPGEGIICRRGVIIYELMLRNKTLISKVKISNFFELHKVTYLTKAQEPQENNVCKNIQCNGVCFPADGVEAGFTCFKEQTDKDIIFSTTPEQKGDYLKTTPSPEWKVTDIHPLSTIISGGINITILGSLMDQPNGTHLILTINDGNSSKEIKMKEKCQLINQETLICTTPNLKGKLISDSDISLERVNLHYTLEVNSVKMDLMRASCKETAPVLYIDPDISKQTFAKIRLWKDKNPTIKINGRNLDVGFLSNQYIVTVNKKRCKTVTVRLDHLMCLLPDDLKSGSDIQVKLGNLKFAAGQLEIEDSIWSCVRCRVAIILSVVFTLLFLCAIVLACVLCRKKTSVHVYCTNIVHRFDEDFLHIIGKEGN